MERKDRKLTYSVLLLQYGMARARIDHPEMSQEEKIPYALTQAIIANQQVKAIISHEIAKRLLENHEASSREEASRMAEVRTELYIRLLRNGKIRSADLKSVLDLPK